MLFPACVSALDVFKISEKHRGSYRRHPRPPSRRTNRYYVLRPPHKHKIHPYCALNERYPAPHTNKHTTHKHTHNTQTDTENAHRPLTHLATSEEEDIEEEVQNDQVDLEWPETQDRPSFRALVVSYKRRDR